MSIQPAGKHLMATITFLGLLPLVYFIPDWIAEMITPHKFTVVFLSLLIIVPLMSYVIIPQSLKILACMKKFQ